MRIPPVNWRRGFNRAFVVLAVGWVGYVLLVYPLRESGKAHQEYTESLDRCRTTEVPSRVIDPNYSRCAEGAEVFLNARLEQYSLRTWLTWPSVMVLLGILVLPPLVAYGLFRLGWFILAWVQRGFRHAV
jgi:hypothetical protein